MCPNWKGTRSGQARSYAENFAKTLEVVFPLQSLTKGVVCPATLTRFGCRETEYANTVNKTRWIGSASSRDPRQSDSIEGRRNSVPYL